MISFFVFFSFSSTGRNTDPSTSVVLVVLVTGLTTGGSNDDDDGNVEEDARSSELPPLP